MQASARGHPSYVQDTVAAYDALGIDFDRSGFGRRSATFEARLKAILLDLLRPVAGAGTALELGAGTGRMIGAVAPLFRELTVSDASAAMVEQCLRRISAGAYPNVRAHQLDAQSLDGIADASVGAIYAVGLLESVPRVAHVLAACHRVLAPGGLLVVSTCNGNCPWYRLRDHLFGLRAIRTGRYLAPSELTQLAQTAGFKLQEMRLWGAAPPRIGGLLALALFGFAERLAIELGLGGRLALIAASFEKA
jgi:SAM-dependent methyltransferase